MDLLKTLQQAIVTTGPGILAPLPENQGFGATLCVRLKTLF
jgi:hypothetical protein